jgi:hypothetical protein
LIIKDALHSRRLDNRTAILQQDRYGTVSKVGMGMEWVWVRQAVEVECGWRCLGEERPEEGWRPGSREALKWALFQVQGLAHE